MTRAMSWMNLLALLEALRRDGNFFAREHALCIGADRSDAQHAALVHAERHRVEVARVRLLARAMVDAHGASVQRVPVWERAGVRFDARGMLKHLQEIQLGR